MTLPDEEVMQLLADRFVLASRNIERERHVGLSHGYACDQTAVGTTNGAGGRNLQLIVLATDETVIHVVPGFWHAPDLLAELRLALDVYALHTDDAAPPERKLAMFGALHRVHLRRHGAAAAERGEWQGFDRHHELERSQREQRDTVAVDAEGNKRLLSIPEVVHARMMQRPFRKLSAFDLESFVDYGRPFYDNNAGHDKGRDFPRAAAANNKRQREQAKAEKAAAKAAKTGDKTKSPTQ